MRAYAREGARVVSLDVDDEAGRKVAAEAGAVAYLHCDVARRAEVERRLRRAPPRTLGGLDVMANVAGVERRTPAEDIPDDEWDLRLRRQRQGHASTPTRPPSGT